MYTGVTVLRLYPNLSFVIQIFALLWNDCFDLARFCHGLSFAGRYWEMVQRLKINQFYGAPTAIRLLLKYGDQWVHKYDRSSLKTLGSGMLKKQNNAQKYYYGPHRFTFALPCLELCMVRAYIERCGHVEVVQYFIEASLTARCIFKA